VVSKTEDAKTAAAAAATAAKEEQQLTSCTAGLSNTTRYIDVSKLESCKLKHTKVSSSTATKLLKKLGSSVKQTGNGVDGDEADEEQKQQQQEEEKTVYEHCFEAKGGDLLFVFATESSEAAVAWVHAIDTLLERRDAAAAAAATSATGSDATTAAAAAAEAEAEAEAATGAGQADTVATTSATADAL
jgi:hypothetical protein